jgi:hypothetical protein
VGSTSGVRVVVGWWHESPFGPFADAMVERADGHRLLIAPTAPVRDLVAATYVFDETRVEPVEVALRPAPALECGSGRQSHHFRTQSWDLASPSLSLSIEVGDRMPLGRLLRVVPGALAESPAWATVVDPVARVVLPRVRTRGVARAGRREYYGATDLHAVTAMAGVLDGIPLGDLRPVDPPCRFGFSSTPRSPCVTDVVTTIVDT